MAALQMRIEERDSKLPDGGYVCTRLDCDASRFMHNHCACGLPRRPTERLCFLCKQENLTAAGRRKRRVSVATTLEFLMGFARALDPGRDR